MITDLVPKSMASKLKTYRNISLLLNPKTLVRNTVGNALFNTFDTASKALATPLDMAIGAFTGQRTRVIPQIGRSFKGAIEGAKRGYQEALMGIDTRGLGQKFDLGQGRQFKNPVMQKLETALDVGLRVPDRAFYEGAFSESVANQLKARGLPIPENLMQAPLDILKRAEQEALEAVFQNDSILSGGVLKLREGLNYRQGDFGAGDVLIPYAQTPANLTQQGVNYSPFGAVKGAVNLVKGDQRQATLDFARALLGTGVSVGGYKLAENGLATASQFADNYVTNQKLRENYELLGQRPDQIANMWYSPFQPMSTSAATGIATQQGADPLLAGLNTIADLPFLQGVSRLSSDLKEGNYVQAGTNLIAGVPGQFVPTILSQVAQFNDPYVRETYSANKFQQGLNQAQQRIPIARKRLPIRYNVKGEPKETYKSEGIGRAFDAFLNPTFINKPIDDPVIQEMKVLKDITGEDTQFLSVPQKTLNFISANGEKQSIKLDNQQLSEYQKELGQQSYNAISGLMADSKYKKLNDEDRVKMIQSIKTQVKQKVENQLFDRYLKQKKNSKIRTRDKK